MGLLAWLGLRGEDTYPNLDALVRELREVLPEDESVVIRYIAIVMALLAKVARADGAFSEREESALRTLLARIQRLSPQGVEAVCDVVRRKIPRLNKHEFELCCRELKAICDRKERIEVMRLLTLLAAVDTALGEEEKKELATIATEIGLDDADLAVLERDAEANGRPSIRP